MRTLATYIAAGRWIVNATGEPRTMTYRLVAACRHCRTVDTFDDPDEAMDAYKDAVWAYAHAPGVGEHGERVQSVNLYGPDGAIVRQWPRP